MSMAVTKDDIAFTSALVSGFILWAMLMIVCG
jgi:hypothetical protein